MPIMTAGVATGARSALGVAEYAAFRALVDDYESPALAGSDDAAAAADALGSAFAPVVSQDVLDLGAGHTFFGFGEGRTFRLSVSPGTIGVSTHDATRLERRVERERTDPMASMLALYADDAGNLALPEPKPARVIAFWSGRSRARMFQTIPQIDFSEWGPEHGALAMVTLTLPGDWLTVAPTGAEFKALLFAFRKRCARAGLDVRALWKLEFQRRGAPHVHLLMRVPALVRGEQYERWLSRTWSEVVAADDVWCQTCGGTSPAAGFDSDLVCSCTGSPDTERERHRRAGTAVDYSGQRFSDPRRIATYFLGHSSKHTDGKEYQHIVPAPWRADGAGPGRFWGYWGMSKGTAVVDLDQREWYAVRRMLRHVQRARAWRLHQAARSRAEYLTRRGQVPAAVKPPRRLRSLGAAGTSSLGGGVVVVNDGIALAYDLGRALAIRRQ